MKEYTEKLNQACIVLDMQTSSLAPIQKQASLLATKFSEAEAALAQMESSIPLKEKKVSAALISRHPHLPKIRLPSFVL